MKDAAKHLQEICGRVSKDGCVLLLDFDGVLSPIVRDYRKAVISPRTKMLLKKCSRHFFVAVISGRGLNDVRTRVGIRGIAYAGNHGLEWHIGERTFRAPGVGSFRTAVRAASREFRKLTKRFRGLGLEDKGLTLSVHYRMVSPRRRADVIKAVLHAVEADVEKGSIVVQKGHMVLNIRPNTKWNKGSVVHHMLGDAGHRLPIFIGDDVTDEDVFKTLKGGITIRVGKGKGSAAHYFFKRRAKVDAFLNELLNTGRTSRPADAR